ncbi:YfiT family bacillithiol transferase [Staphylococcus intermedius]|uniref:Metal-dependent hydrolase n=1 Tax=Staphylococcus intermedius NCTC 11048 TaxID=1141106 RepID=A0A380G570_STAIN|nr:putative metal-dependent hydrolase [Staphylococcus intermedius]PCF64085.1 metal-dependent hydrolase [Staphylococcus intermedius]PCF78801.1 metal-dependent hydrolase [Staphylococcus intermedius]PCF79773.1 metal-dependent hydrolase [Staphylococcus intermedius]PCF85876.1 metal-dependent hydrolase [Staphylococcus intermedius]PCF89568.1 metal-dependent hydrolase [Staphylococcus intermedius]
MDVRYPIGGLEMPDKVTRTYVDSWLEDITQYVQDLRKTVTNLNQNDLQATYREGSFTVQQLVHHIADSQMNMFQRLKLALTDTHPQVPNFVQDEWVKLADSDLPIDVSIQMLEAINQRVVAIGQQLTEAELTRDFVLENSGATTVGETIAKLSWHERHHLAHIQIALGQFDIGASNESF